MDEVKGTKIHWLVKRLMFFLWYERADPTTTSNIEYCPYFVYGCPSVCPKVLCPSLAHLILLCSKRVMFCKPLVKGVQLLLPGRLLFNGMLAPIYSGALFKSLGVV